MQLSNPEPWEDPKNGSTLGLYKIHHRRIRAQSWGFNFVGSSHGSGKKRTGRLCFPVPYQGLLGRLACALRLPLVGKQGSWPWTSTCCKTAGTERCLAPWCIQRGVMISPCLRVSRTSGLAVYKLGVTQPSLGGSVASCFTSLVSGLRSYDH